ncbi:MAG TPA: methyltransferase domain-containing protein [Bdellovibrionales bacterium]|mgnify:CR=1 FL=1|nr:methyltransferase domain-containing protein [Bdellovibrionales bacterium]
MLHTGNDDNRLLQILVGDRFGATPLNSLAAIRAERRERARPLAASLDLGPSDRVLELGSGCGWAALELAPRVAEYHCADVQEEFLRFAGMELRGVDNVHMHKMAYGDFKGLHSLGITKSLAMDVFTQFNLHDHAIYLREVYELLPVDGWFYFNYLNADFLNVRTNAKFLRHNRLFAEDRTQFPLLTHWTSARTMRDIARDIGFAVQASEESPEHSWMVLRKASGS